MRRLTSLARSTAPSSGTNAKSSAAVLLSSPAAAQRCAEGAGLDSGAAVAAQSAMPSIALSAAARTIADLITRPATPVAPQLQSRISTTLTDVTVRARFQQPCQMNHFYRNVPKLGNVAVSRHAQKRMEEEQISQEAFERVLLMPVKQDIRDGADILWRERDRIRIVILENPVPSTGAKLVKTVYRIQAQAKAKAR